MKKKAQTPYEYYGNEELGLLPGVSLVNKPEAGGETPKWLLPLGVTAAGLTGLALLRGAKHGLTGLVEKLRSTKSKAAPWSWDLEVGGRLGKHYESPLHPGEAIGSSYKPHSKEGMAKLNSLSILCHLDKFAKR